MAQSSASERLLPPPDSRLRRSYGGQVSGGPSELGSCGGETLFVGREIFPAADDESGMREDFPHYVGGVNASKQVKFQTSEAAEWTRANQRWNLGKVGRTVSVSRSKWCAIDVAGLSGRCLASRLARLLAPAWQGRLALPWRYRESRGSFRLEKPPASLLCRTMQG